MHNITIACTHNYLNNSAASNLVFNLAAGLNNSNCAISIYDITNQSDICISESSVTKLVNVFSYKSLKFNSRLLKHLTWATKLVKVIDNSTTNISLLILYGVDRPYWTVPILMYCRKNKIPVIRIVTEVYSGIQNVSYVTERFLLFLDMVQIKYLDKKFNGIVVLNSYLEELYRQNNNNNVLKCHHFVKILDKQTRFKNTGFKVIYAGTYSKNNGVDYFIKAAALLKERKEIAFGIIGDMPVSEMTRKFGELDYINFYGYLNNDKTIELIRDSSILINPIIPGIHADSGFPTKVAEYMASGVPVLSTKTGEIYKLFSKLNFMTFCEPFNENDMADKIVKIYENYQYYLDFAENARIWALENLNRDANACKIINKFIPNEKKL